MIEKSTEELNVKDLIPLQSGVRREDSVKRSNLNDRKELKEPQKGNEEMEKYVFPSISPGIYVGIIKISVTK